MEGDATTDMKQGGELDQRLVQGALKSQTEPTEHDESVRDLKRHLRIADGIGDDEQKGMERANSLPTLGRDDVVTVSQLAVPGGFRRHHVNGAVVHRQEGRGLIDQLMNPLRILPGLELQNHDSMHSFSRGEGSSNIVTVLVLLKTFLTGTVLVIPMGFKQAGLLGGCCVILFIGFCEVYCMNLLVACRAKAGHGTYRHLCSYLGPWGPHVLSAMLVASQYAFVCAEQVYVADNALQALKPFLPELEQWQLLALGQVFLVPLSCVRKLKFFAVTNLLGDVIIITCLLYLFGYGMFHLSEEGVHEDVELFGSWNGMLLCASTCVYVYEGINVVLPIYEAHENKENYNKILTSVLAPLTIIFVCFGSLWYCAFGSSVAGVATLNLPGGSAEASVVSGFYALACLLTTPVLYFPFVSEIEPRFFSAATWESRPRLRKWAKNIFRIMFMLLSGVIAAIGGQNFQKFLAIIGGLCCAPLAIMLPAACHRIICEANGFWKHLDAFLLIVGACLLVYAARTSFFPE